jgi:hypothetical protein
MHLTTLAAPAAQVGGQSPTLELKLTLPAENQNYSSVSRQNLPPGVTWHLDANDPIGLNRAVVYGSVEVGTKGSSEAASKQISSRHQSLTSKTNHGLCRVPTVGRSLGFVPNQPKTLLVPWLVLPSLHTDQQFITIFRASLPRSRRVYNPAGYKLQVYTV